ncbi:MAG: TonB-dependent receptor [Opitutaceae bacterium]|nr:TonB-dependent receptor [Opitutaceae bacterium]
MKTSPVRLKFLHFVLRCLPAMIAGILCAQTVPSGTVTGRVYNPSTAEYVRNAEVRLEGTSEVTYTENDGTFAFRGVPAGTTTITVSYSGYVTVRDSFTVTAGQAAVREINVVSTAAARGTEDVIKLQAFTVSSEREGNSKAIMEQRRNMDITTSVASDIFGDVTDGNVGEFLKYLPGVDLDYVESEARGPRLGGMEGQYVGVSFDGIRSASADANRGGGDASRATSFEGFSITSIESIEISRTRSPESDADAPAGTINMKTRRAFDRKGRRFGYNFSINTNAEEFTFRRTPGPNDGYNYKWKPNLSLEYSESFLDQRFGVLLSVSRANSYTEQYSFSHGINRSSTALDPRPAVIRSIGIKDGPKFILKDALMLTADFKATRRLVLSFNAIYTYAEGDFWNRTFDFTAANDNANVNNGRATVGGDGLLTVIGTRAPSGSVNNVAQISNGSGTSTKLTYTRTFAPKFEYKLDEWTFDGAFTFSKSVNNYEALERGFSESESLTIPSSFVATRPNLESWEWTIRQTSGPDWFDMANWTGGTRMENSGREWITEIWNGQANARWVLPFMRRLPTILKLGGKWNEESRDNNNIDAWNIWRYIGPGGDVLTGYNATTGVPTVTTSGNWGNLGFISPHPFDTGTTNALTVYNIGGVNGMPPRADRIRIANLYRSNPELFVHTGTPDNYYNSFITNKRDFRQTMTAAYTQADIRVTSKMRLLGGIRWENTKNEVTEWEPQLREEVVAAGFPVNTSGRATTFPGLQYQYQSNPRVTRSSEYHNWFPSVTTKYMIARNFELQAGYSKAIGRPPIDNLTGLWNIIEDANGVTQRVDAPNPKLLPEHIKKFDARLAYYFGGRVPGQLSVHFSQFDVLNLRESHDYSAAEFGIDDPEFQDYIFRSTRNSEQRRRSRNMEVNYQQTLGFLPELFRGTSVNVAYTRSYASARRSGLAPHRVTSRLGYAYRRFYGSLGMVWIDDRPDGSGTSNPGRFRPEQTQFDLTLNWKFTSQVALYVQGRNITNQPVKWMDTMPGYPQGSYPILRQYQEYGANWVFGVKGSF